MADNEKYGCGCGCGDENCDRQEFEDDDIVELIDDEGNTIKFIHVATVDYKNEWYAFFSPTEEVDGIDTDEVVIFRVDSDKDGKDIFSPVEDEKLLDEVYNEYLKMLDEEEQEQEE